MPGVTSGSSQKQRYGASHWLHSVGLLHCCSQLDKLSHSSPTCLAGAVGGHSNGCNYSYCLTCAGKIHNCGFGGYHGWDCGEPWAGVGCTMGDRLAKDVCRRLG